MHLFLQGDDKKLESALKDKEVEENLEQLLENKQPEDLTESEEADLEKLMSAEDGMYHNNRVNLAVRNITLKISFF